MIADECLTFDVIAGIETAGIPHSAALAYSLYRPSVFVRKQAKEHTADNHVVEVRHQKEAVVELVVGAGDSQEHAGHPADDKC